MSETKEQILKIRDLDITFQTTAGSVHAIRGVNIDLMKGETVAIVGESGSGKSVTMKAAMGILASNAKVTGGTIEFSYHHADGTPQTVDILTKDKKWIRRHINGKRIAMVFQDPMTSLDPTMTIGKQIMEGMIWHFKTPKKEAWDKAVELFGKYKVFSKAELESRVEIKYENYAKAINIEAKTMIDMASKQILPAVIGYTKSLADTILAVKGAGAPATVQTDLLNDVSKLLEEAKAALVTLEEVTDKAAEAGDMAAEARYFYESVVPAMAALRTPVDKLEVLVDKKVWPMPSYSDLLFEV